MDTEILKEIILGDKNNSEVCPKCEKRGTLTQAKFFMRPIKGTTYLLVDDLLPYCDNCKKHYATHKYCAKLAVKYWGFCLKPGKGYGYGNAIQNYVVHSFTSKQPEKEFLPMSPYVDHVVLDGKRVKVDHRTPIGKIKKNIWITLGKFSICPICNQSLSHGYIAAVPIGPESCVKCELSVCNKCNEYFSEKRKFVQELHALCTNKQLFTLNTIYTSDIESYKMNSQTQKISSAIYRFIIATDRMLRVYTIVSDKSEENTDQRLIHYCNPLALELLTTYVLKAKSITIDGVDFTVQHYECLQKRKESIRIITPHNHVVIEKRKNGGYYDPDKSIILVDGLVFCEKSNRLEILPVSYDSKTDLYFVDSRLYTSFVRQHGYPIVSYAEHHGSYYSDLKDESLLHQLGYTVNQKDNLSKKERQEMLGRFVDLGFISIASIQNLLWSLIARNGAKNPICKAKWEEDSSFIGNYRRDHDRFVFVESVKKRSI